MRKGLLAEWRRGMVARGLAAAALLAVPVAVAAAIGFGSSVSGLTDGLDALASGPDGTQGAPPSAGSDEIDSAIAAISTTATTDPPAVAQQPGPGGNSPQTPAPPGGDDVSTPEGASPPPSEGGPVGIDTPQVDVPGANPVNDLVQGLNDTINGLLGGGGQ